MDPQSLGGIAVELASEWHGFLVSADEPYLRHIPEPGVNSPIQYAAHVRDIMKVYGERMALGLAQDSPTVPIFNPPQATWEEYNRADPEQLAADIQARAARLSEIVDEVEPGQWNRIVINDRGQYGVYTFTIAGLARNVVHEAYHHLLDAKGTLFSTAS
jgi:hypothetical protein